MGSARTADGLLYHEGSPPSGVRVFKMPEPSLLPLLATLTTLRLGGLPRSYVEATSDAEVVQSLTFVAASSSPPEPVLVLGGGSNLVVADAGFPGRVVRMATRGVSFDDRGDRTLVTAAAGEPWDHLVAECVARGLRGFECLSGIPGSVGAVPLQNVGAYGQEVSDTLVSVRAFDRTKGCEVHVPAKDCAFGYRTSAFRGRSDRVVLGVTFALEKGTGATIPDYAELRRALGAGASTLVPLAVVRETVLALRRNKGMVLDAADPDSASAGSFFTNPILSDEDIARLEVKVRDVCGAGVSPPLFPDPASGRTKSSAAWLIERAGFARGYGEGRAGLSSKHTLALVNRGGATTRELLAVAKHVRDGVRHTFGVTLEPEPVFVGFAQSPGSAVLDAL
jgi:UDP-N-acetylmuramate dehydrogenase